ncbi:protein kinase [Streptomyces sp. NPDC096205]|uniref:serine/threonine-protein kinase n=1 Tax=Streptomyces sp. NPDC096205 TaxID=3366081 RepID=UPI0037F1B1F6
MLVAGRYLLETPLGRGAMGEVWRATDQTLNRSVALKLLTGEAAEKDTARFHLEAQTAARLNHPHVVGVYDFGSHAGQPYLVMELVEGWSLAQERSLRGTLAPAEAALLVGQLANGLAAAHRQGVIHRDIKPANVMLTADRVAKITDFGIARFADAAAGALTATGTVVGSAAYLAPERALGRPAEPPCDVYAMGCVLYELLTGRPPFTGATSLAVVQQQVDAAPVPPARLRPDIPEPLSAFVLRLLDKDPARRPTAGEAATWLTTLPGGGEGAGAEHAYPAAPRGQGFPTGSAGFAGGPQGQGGGPAGPHGQGYLSSGPQGQDFAAAPQGAGLPAARHGQGYAAAPQGAGLPAARQGQGYAAAPQGQGYAAPPQERGFASAPQERGFPAPPQERGFAVPPQERGFAAPPHERGFAARPQFATPPQGHALPAATPEGALPAAAPVPSPSTAARPARPAPGRRRPARPRGGLSPKVLFAVGGVLVFGASAALGAGLASGDSDDASPEGTSTSSSPDRPAAGTPTPPPSPSTVMSDGDGHKEQGEAGEKRGKSEEEDREDDD